MQKNESKRFRRKGSCIFDNDYRKESTQENLGRQGYRIGSRVQKKICKAEGVEIYSTKRETKAAFTECTIRSLKNILYRYMGDYGYKYFHKFSQFATTLISRRIFSIDLIPKNAKNSVFLSILYSKPLRDKKLKLKIGDRVRISKYDLPFRKRNKPPFTQEVFEILAISHGKPPRYTMKDEQDKIIRRKFFREELIKVI